MLELLMYPLAVLGIAVASVLLFLLVTGLCATVDLGFKKPQRPAARDGAAG
jgi:hypothetical protein